MTRKMILIGGLLGLTVLTTSVFGESAQKATSTPTRFTIVLVEQIGSKAKRAMIRDLATKPNLAKVREQLRLDTSLSSRLRARGIELRNVIRIERALNGALVIYVR